MKVFVLLHKSYVYADPRCGGDDEYKDILTSDNPSIEGIFKTKKSAEKQMIYLIEEFDDEEDYIEHQKEYHYSIEEYNVEP